MVADIQKECISMQAAPERLAIESVREDVDRLLHEIADIRTGRFKLKHRRVDSNHRSIIDETAEALARREGIVSELRAFIREREQEGSLRRKVPIKSE